jgi:hypothetical protein
MLLVVSAAHAGVFYVDAAQADRPGCGMALDRACRTYGYWYSSGCDADGCGNNVAAGDTVYFRAGTYNGDGAGGYVGIPFVGETTAPVTMACFDAPRSCVIDGSGVSTSPWCDLVGIGLRPGSAACESNGAAYVTLQGFTIQHPPSGAYTLGVSAPADHVLITNNTIDGTGSYQNLIVSGDGPIHDVTVLGNTISNCPASGSGCSWINEVSKIAIVGNAFGPVPGDGNYDCTTLVGVQKALVDGNSCHDTFDGFDDGMNSNRKLTRVIVRYNEVYGNNTGRAFPISGNGASRSNRTGHNVFYKNVAHALASGPCFQPYGGADGIDIWYNTCFAPSTAGWGGLIWLQTNYGGDWDENIGVKYNIFDTTSVSAYAPLVLDRGTTTVKACPARARCPFVKNGIWMPERGGSAGCVYWHPSDGALQTYTCDQFGTSFNTDHQQMSDNFRANPYFVDRTQPQILDNLRLTAASTRFIDAGDSFCHARTASRGNRIRVTCSGKVNDARYYFPDPADFYGLANSDCKGKGVRAADGVDPGCYDIQIQGECGTRQVLAVHGRSITFSGAPCSWVQGAMVHLPWNGAAPDVGALELASP